MSLNKIPSLPYVGLLIGDSKTGIRDKYYNFLTFVRFTNCYTLANLQNKYVRLRYSDKHYHHFS